MSEQSKDGLYVFQPFGMQDGKERWEAGRIYAISGLPMLATIKGLTKPEAEAVLAALVLLGSATDSSTAERAVERAGALAPSSSSVGLPLAPTPPETTAETLMRGELAQTCDQLGTGYPCVQCGKASFLHIFKRILSSPSPGAVAPEKKE